jgi:hypothetical protein
MGNFHQVNKENEQPMNSNYGMPMDDGNGAFQGENVMMTMQMMGDQHPMSFIPQ